MKFYDRVTRQTFVVDHETQLTNMFEEITANPVWRMRIPAFETIVISDRRISLNPEVFEAIAAGELMEDDDMWQRFLEENRLIEDPDNVF